MPAEESFSKLEAILDYLFDQIDRGWLALTVNKHLSRAYDARRITIARYFFASAFWSSAEAAILALSRLVVKHKRNDSLNVHYLLNYAETFAEAFPHAKKTTVLAAIATHRQELDKINSLVNNLKGQRDQTIAHLDKAYVNDPDSIFSRPPISMDEVEKAYLLVLGIINTYSSFLNSSEHGMSHFDQEVQEDLEYLLNLAERDQT